MAKKIIFLLILSLLLFFLLVDEAVASSPPFAGARVVDEAVASSPPFARLHLARVSDFGLAQECDPACSEGQVCKKGKCVGRALEIVYPKIAGDIIPETTATELPDYVVYIFRFAVVIIGFVIFGALVYAGVNYLASAGNPAKLADAKEGILAAFLGTVILLSAWLVFNTINPQLTILTLSEVDPLAQVIMPGVYICSYDVGPPIIEDVLTRYIDKGLVPTDPEERRQHIEEQTKAAKELRQIMAESEEGTCPRANFSGNFDNFVVKENYTIFIIPTIELVPEGNDYRRKPVYEYGIVLHEKDDFRGKCSRVYPDPVGDNNNLLYTYNEEEPQIRWKLPLGLGFTNAKSVTVFKKPAQDPSGAGIILFTCLDFNRTGMCPGNVTEKIEEFGTDGDILKYKTTELKEMQHNTLSAKIDPPKGGYFALLFDEDIGVGIDPNISAGECAVFKANDPNISDLRLKTCNRQGNECGSIWSWWNIIPINLAINVYRTLTEECVPCLNSMIVIKGQAL